MLNVKRIGTKTLITGYSRGKIMALGFYKVPSKRRSNDINSSRRISTILILGGQPFINSHEVIMVVKGNKFRLLKNNSFNFPGYELLKRRKVPL